MSKEGFEGSVVPFGPRPEAEKTERGPEFQFADFTKDEMANLNARIVSRVPWATEGLEHPVFKDMPAALVNALKAASQKERNAISENAILMALDNRFDVLDQEAA